MRGPAEGLMSQVEIGKRLGISHTLVARYERRALEKIRRWMLADRELREELESNGFALAAPAEGD